jgi:hypothetical protein
MFISDRAAYFPSRHVSLGAESLKLFLDQLLAGSALHAGAAKALQSDRWIQTTAVPAGFASVRGDNIQQA